jgi:uncharacterized protein (DUF1778 family)
MKLNLSKFVLVVFIAFAPVVARAQLLQLSPANADKLLDRLSKDKSISADEVLKTFITGRLIR